MRLTKGSMLIHVSPITGNRACGVLLYRKGCKWYYSLTSPHNETGNIITTIQWATRQSIVRGIESKSVKYYPAKKRSK